MPPKPQNLTREEELNRLLVLKKIQESQRSFEERREMDALNLKHAMYAKLNATEMEELQNQPALTALSVQNRSGQAFMLKDYAKQFPGSPKPVVEAGMVVLTFKSEKDAGDFLLSQAVAGRQFKVFDAQNRLIAFSSGNGTLQHADGRQFKPGNSFTPLPDTPQATAQTRNLLTPLSPRSLKPTPIPPLMPKVPVPLSLTPLTEDPNVKYKSPRPTPFNRPDKT